MTELTTALQYILTHDEGTFRQEDFIKIVEIDAKKVLDNLVKKYEGKEESDPEFAKMLKAAANERIFLLYFMLGFLESNNLMRSVEEMRKKVHSFMSQINPKKDGKNSPDSN